MHIYIKVFTVWLALVLTLAWGGAAAGATFEAAAPAPATQLDHPLPEGGFPDLDAEEEQVEAKPPPEVTGLPGVNLLPAASNFRINTAAFSENSHDVVDGCVEPGRHTLLRFDFLVHNAGMGDLVLGEVAEAEEYYVPSLGHGHYHLRDFNEYQLFDPDGQQVVEGHKQNFCLYDNRRISPWAQSRAQFGYHDCDSSQGLSAGWADIYAGHLTCQYITIDNVPDGDYAFLATTNAQAVITEASYADNRTCVELRIQGNKVSEIHEGLCQQLEGQLPELRKPTMNILIPCELQQVPACIR